MTACLMLGLGVWGTCVNAQDSAAALAAARAKYPATDVRTAQPTPLPGIYEFDMGGETVYGDGTARYLILGRLIDMEAAPPTPPSYNEVADLAFELQAGPKGEVVLFSDPNCHYCAKFEHRLLAGELAGYRIKVILTEVTGGNRSLGDAILCSLDPAVTYRSYVLERQQPVPCAGTANGTHRVIAQAAGITATPSFLVPNGELLVGLPEADELLAWVAAGQVRP